MGFEYALVHLKYTIPPAIILTYLYRGVATRLDICRIAFLISVATISTTPWDSYLIRQRIWTYPPHVIIGPKLFDIPAEGLFFFVVQTYNTSLLYLFLSKTVTHAAYLLPAQQTCSSSSSEFQSHTRLEAARKHGITITLAATIFAGGVLTARGDAGTYLGLILIWAGPFALLLWHLSGYMIQRLPLSSTLLPIVLPTMYLWIVDTLALRRGTWAITSGTKLGMQVWRGLEIEEALFFLVTNTLIVFGLLTFDHAIAILDAMPTAFPHIDTPPPAALLFRALQLRGTRHESNRIYAIRDATDRLRTKSRSFYFASGFFTGRTRIDLMLLYSFCRVADDLVDNATSRQAALESVAKLREFLDVAYGRDTETNMKTGHTPDVEDLITRSFPADMHSALLLLPTAYLPSAPLYGLLDGFETDLRFNDGLAAWPIHDERDMELYAACVAGTVAELCIELILHHNLATPVPQDVRRQLVTAGRSMGIALQYVNIARDISVDAAMKRVYLPQTWLKQEGLTPEDVLVDPTSDAVLRLRERLLDEAQRLYRENRNAIEGLPGEQRAPMRVAVESYMEIGRVLRQGQYRVKAGRATVPAFRRVRVGWRALHK